MKTLDLKNNSLQPGDKIPLIASDFDDLNVSAIQVGFDGTARLNQNSNVNSGNDCPIVRATKRMGGTHVQMIGYAGLYVDGVPATVAGQPHDLERCRLELLAGAEEAFINVIN